MSRKLDSRALELFVAVAESLSFGRAAEALHLSQPPLSRAIRQLEERLDTRLFERDRRTVALTAAGRRLLPRAQQILRLIDDAQASITPDPQPSVLRLGLTNAAEPSWFQGLGERISELHRGITVETSSGTSPRLVRKLRSGQLHAAFIALPTDTAELQVIEIEKLPLCVALSAAHPLARKRMLRLRDLANESLFWFERARQPAFFDHSFEVFARHGFRPAMLREPDDHHVLLAEIASNKGVALLPSSFRALRRPGVAYRWLAEGAELSLGIALALPHGDSPWHRVSLSALKDDRPGRRSGARHE